MRSAIFAALLAAACAASAQQLYRWTDESGRVFFTDQPPPRAAKAVQKLPQAPAGRAAPADTAGLPYAVQLAAKDFPVTLYTGPECGPCGEARSLLNARGVPFREVLVTDEAQQQELQKAVGALAVPAMLVGSTVQKGFEAGAYHGLLDIAGYPKTGEVPARRQPEPRPASAPAAAAEEAQAKPAAQAEAPASGPYVPGSSATGQRTRK